MKYALSAGRVFGIPVRLHATLLIALPVLAGNFLRAGDGLLPAILLAAGFFGSILLHETGHSLAARRMGVSVREIVLHPFGGFALMEQAFARPGSEFFISAAGPAVSFLLYLAFRLLDLFFSWSFGPFSVPAVLAWSLARLNGWVCLFNLVPAFPLDGGRILRALLAAKLGRERGTRIVVWCARVSSIVFAAMGLMPWFRGESVDFFYLFVAWFVWVASSEERKRVAPQAPPAF